MLVVKCVGVFFSVVFQVDIPRQTHNRGGQESDWVYRIGEDLVAFGMKEEKEGGRWKESAKDQEAWYDKIEDGAAWFMRKWHRQEAEASAKRQRAREAEAESPAIPLSLIHI